MTAADETDPAANQLSRGEIDPRVPAELSAASAPEVGTGLQNPGDTGGAQTAPSLRRRVAEALPLLLVGGGCLAIGLLLWRERNAVSSPYAPWELFLALGLSALVGGVISLVVSGLGEPPSAEESEVPEEGTQKGPRVRGPNIPSVDRPWLSSWARLEEEPEESPFHRGDGSPAVSVQASNPWNEERDPLDEDYAESYLEEPLSLFAGMSGEEPENTNLAIPPRKAQWPTTEEVTSELDDLRASLKGPLPTRLRGTSIDPA